MASKDRTTAADLSGFLSRYAKKFSAFQAIALIENQLDDGREVGTHEHAANEKLIFEVDHNLGFPGTDVISIKKIPPARKGGANRYRMMVTFLGLHGSGTSLPSYYAEQIAFYHGDESTSKAFFDFFHNRIISLFYRAWRKPRYYHRYRPQGKDQFSSWIFSLFGLASPQSRKFTNVYWPRLLCFAGLLSTRNRSPALFSTVISRAFHLDCVNVEEWVERKVRISQDQLTRVGSGNSVLGQSFVAGTHSRDVQGKIRIVVKNLDFKRFQDFLPHGKDFQGLRGLVEFMLRDQLGYDLKLGLKPGEAYPITLRKDCPGRLGWSSFLGDGRINEMRDVIIRVRS